MGVVGPIAAAVPRFIIFEILSVDRSDFGNFTGELVIKR
jgi:hypothetical protein